MKAKVLGWIAFLAAILAKLTLGRYRPRVIGITGSVGKTSTKLAVATVLSIAGQKRVRAAGGNLNSELGLPLAVLGDYQQSGGPLFWFKVLLGSTLKLFLPWRRSAQPQVLVLEYGADRPGDIKKLMKIVKPDVAVVTAVGETPVHIEFYQNREEVIREKSELVVNLTPPAKAVLNADEAALLELKKKIAVPVMTFGFSQEADLRISNFENRSQAGKPFGISFKLETETSSVPVRIEGIFGRGQAYAAAAAAAVGLIEGLNLVEIAEALSFYRGERGRLRLIPGIKQSYLLDDSYNSSPASAENALRLLADLPASRKIAVLGDMLELGEYTIAAHEAIGQLAAEVVDLLVTVGPRSKFLAASAKQAGLKSEDVYSFDTADQAKLAVQSLIEEGDLVLIKGSQGMRMEKIVLEVMAEPQKAPELLVRQYGKWLAN
jgi:UDP-N-acetylmuramoyl-tripeptide--D-alanyl-D-alanine ligase